MGLCKPAHYSSQRKIRKAEGTTLAVISSSENVSRKAGGKKKKAVFQMSERVLVDGRVT